jgi:hypothetical protein
MRFFRSGLVRGLAIVALVSIAIVVLSAEWSLVVVGAVLWVAFLVALAFVLVRVWRERRGEADHWSRRGRITFVAALLVAAIAVAHALLMPPTRGDAIAFFVVLAVVAFVLVRVWRDEQRLA